MLRDDWRNILRAFCLRIAETAGYAVSVTFMLSYISEEKLAGRSTTLTATMIAAAIGIFATTFFSRMIVRPDEPGRPRMALRRGAQGQPSYHQGWMRGPERTRSTR